MYIILFYLYTATAVELVCCWTQCWKSWR